MRNSLPQARVVKQGGQLFAPPPPPPTRRPGELKAQLREAAAMAIGMWPLTAVCVLMFVLLVFAANWSAP